MPRNHPLGVLRACFMLCVWKTSRKIDVYVFSNCLRALGYNTVSWLSYIVVPSCSDIIFLKHLYYSGSGQVHYHLTSLELAHCITLKQAEVFQSKLHFTSELFKTPPNSGAPLSWCLLAQTGIIASETEKLLLHGSSCLSLPAALWYTRATKPTSALKVGSPPTNRVLQVEHWTKNLGL